MTTLVTGATGLLGNNIVRMLLERGEGVRTLVRPTSDSRPLEGLNVERIEGDVRDASSLQRAMRGVERVVHSAAAVHIGWRRLEEHRAINADGARNVAEAARRAGATMVHISTVDTLGIGSPEQPADEETSFGPKPPCTYVVTKLEAERAVEAEMQKGLDAVVVHPGFMLGPYDWKPSSGRMLLEVARRWTPLAPAGGCSVCDVRDVAAGVLAAADRGERGRRYILAGENLPYLELWRLMAEATSTRPPRRAMGGIVGGAAGWLGDAAARITGQEGDINSAAIAMSRLYHYYSSERAAAELDYQSRSPRESIHDAWRWFVEEGYAKG